MSQALLGEYSVMNQISGVQKSRINGVTKIDSRKVINDN